MTIRRVPQDFDVREQLEPAFARAVGPLGALAPAPAGVGHTVHAVLVLTKTGTTTPEALAMLARAIGPIAGRAGSSGGAGGGGQFDYAGLKDKHAVTEQHVSLPVAADRASAVAERLSVPLSGQGWSAHLLGWSPEPVTAAAITGNRFDLVVRDLAPGASGEMDVRARMLRTPGDDSGLLFINYFGAQRFGSARHGRGFAAAHLVRGEFEAAVRLLIASPARKDSGKTRVFSRLAAGKWGQWAELAAELPRCPERAAVELLAARAKRTPPPRPEPAPADAPAPAPVTARANPAGQPAPADFRDAFAALPYFTQQMAVESFQSHLWNEVARRLARRIAAESTLRPRARLVSTHDPYGVMLFPESRGIADHWRSCRPALLGPGAALSHPWELAAREVLAESGLTLDGLAIPGLRRPAFGVAERPLIARASGFEMGPPEPDELSAPKRVLRRVRFQLPRGAYATVVLRALGQ